LGWWRWRYFERFAQIRFAYFNFLTALRRFITENNITVGIVGFVHLAEGHICQAQQPEAKQRKKQVLC
jgi:hypothetical protein